jgi:hypothetical protein
MTVVEVPQMLGVQEILKGVTVRSLVLPSRRIGTPP